MTSRPSLEPYRLAFEAQLKRRRPYRRIAIVAMIAFAATFPVQPLLPAESQERIALLGAAFFAVAFVAIAIASTLYCTSCQGRIDRGVERFCPECGGSELRGAGFLRAAHCLSCGRSFTRGKGGRRWRIRICTHCGAPLSEEGV